MSGDAPTSLEMLRRHRAAHADDTESRRVWLFHSHAYFDHESPDAVASAHAFRELVRTTFASNPHVEVNGIVPRPTGPHPRASFEVLFTRDAFTEYVSWLMFARPSSVSVLVHPLTRSQSADHAERAVWLGERLAMELGILEAVDAKTLATGRSEESIIDATKRH